MKLTNLLLGVTPAIFLPLLSSFAGQFSDSSSEFSASSERLPVQELPFKVSASIRGGYDSNPTTASGVTFRDPSTGSVIFEDKEQGSFFTGANVDFSKSFGSPRTNFELGLGAGITYYFDLPDDDVDYTLDLRTSFSHAVTPRLSLSGNFNIGYQIEPDYTNTEVVTRPGRNGQYLFGNAGLSAAYQWTTRFSTVTSYRVSGVLYELSAVGQVDDRIDQTFGQAFRFLVRPTTTLVAEYRYGMVSYESDSERDYTSHYILGGVDHSFSPRLSSSLRAGVQIVDGASNASSEPYAEASLNYLYGPSSNLKVFANYGFDSSSRATESSSNTSLRTGFTITHGISAKLSANVGGYYSHRDESSSMGASTTENLLNATAGLTYNISRNWFTSLQYSYSTLDSGSELRDYDRHLTFLSQLELHFKRSKSWVHLLAGQSNRKSAAGFICFATTGVSLLTLTAG